MKQQRVLWCALAALLGICFAGNAVAGWKEDQAAMFQQIPVKPGDKIDKANWEKVKGIIPPSMVEYVKKGDFVINVEELKWDYQPDAEWRKKSAANAGKYVVDKDGALIEKATGQRPLYVDGDPFPDIDWKNDPQAGVKIAHNYVIKGSRSGTVVSDWSTVWVNRKGPERIAEGTWTTYNYWARPDGETSNPQKLLLASLIRVTRPYDIAGIVSLNQRYIDTTVDQGYTYIPSIRRVKKVAGTTRSSPFLGTDFCNDDSYNWYGKNETMEWKVIDRKIVLMAIQSYNLEGPLKYIHEKNGAWGSPTNVRNCKAGYEVEGWKGAQWAPVDLAYVPRMMYVVTATPKDPYYNFGVQTFYVDPFQGMIYKIVTNRAGEHWKTLISTNDAGTWGDGKITTINSDWQLAIDDKTDHATWNGNLGLQPNGYTFRRFYSSPDITKALFSPTALPALSK